MDAPRNLASDSERAERRCLLSQPHMVDLVRLVESIRTTKGPSHQVPDFDPLDGGTSAQVLFLLEAPGPRAVTSGFVSRNNPDATAKNFFLLSEQAGIPRGRTVVWNAVPWYIGTGTKIRQAHRADVLEAGEWLAQLLAVLPQLRWVMFVGKQALHAQGIVRRARPAVDIMTMRHPSPVFVNRRPGNRERILASMRELSACMAAASDERPVAEAGCQRQAPRLKH